MEAKAALKAAMKESMRKKRVGVIANGKLAKASMKKAMKKKRVSVIAKALDVTLSPLELAPPMRPTDGVNDTRLTQWAANVSLGAHGLDCGCDSCEEV